MNLSAVIFKRTVSWPKVTRTLAITVVSGIILTVFIDTDRRSQFRQRYVEGYPTFATVGLFASLTAELSAP